MMMQFTIISYFVCFVKALRLDFLFIYQFSEKSRPPAHTDRRAGLFQFLGYF